MSDYIKESSSNYLKLYFHYFKVLHQSVLSIPERDNATVLQSMGYYYYFLMRDLQCTYKFLTHSIIK